MNITYTDIKNPRWNDADHETLVCDVNFTHISSEEYSPFTARASGDLPHTHQIFAECVAGKWGVIAEYEPYVPTPEELEPQIRWKRDSLLKETDWTQAADVPQATKDLWAPYRQALRDVPQQAGFPTDITWPVPPA